MPLIRCGRDKMVAILKATFSNRFSWKKSLTFYFEFPSMWSGDDICLSMSFQVLAHCRTAPSNYPNQCCLIVRWLLVNTRFPPHLTNYIRQCHGCWCLGSLHRQVIINIGIDYKINGSIKDKTKSTLLIVRRNQQTWFYSGKHSADYVVFLLRNDKSCVSLKTIEH